MISIDTIRAAAKNIAGHVVRTPAVDSPRLAELTGAASVVLKLENQQHTGSFKDRGAYNKLSQLEPAQAARGVIAMSAGNHAQGVAFHATRLNIASTIVMPEGTPFNKIERTENYGARVVLRGENIDASGQYAHELAERDGLTFVHPFDDERIIQGQGTVGLELLDDRSDLEVIIVPVGGGGLLAGIAVAARALKPDIELYGVEVDSYASMHHAINALPAPVGGQTLAEGIAVKSPGKLTRPLIEQHVEEVLLVEEDAIEDAVQTLVQVQKLVVEGAGAAGLAAMKSHPDRFADKRVGIAICGGNIDPRLLAQVLMRGLMREGRVVTLRIGITDRPGTLAHLAQIIGERGGNIIEIYHQRLFHDLPVKNADVDAVVETRNGEHAGEIVAALESGGFGTRVLSSRSQA
ncbi:MAG: threonine ammonia-lyase [Gammaproteobacteria bacterium]